MKKIGIILLSLLLLTGCTAEYNLKIDSSYSENIIIRTSSSDEQKSFLSSMKIETNYDDYIEGMDEETKIDDTKSYYEYSYSNGVAQFNNEFTISELINSTALKSCYNDVTVTLSNGNIVLLTDSKFTCFDKYPTLGSVKVNITTDHEVIKNNADSVNNNVYTWNINKSNYNNKVIKLIISQSSNSSSSSSSQKQIVSSSSSSSSSTIKNEEKKESNNYEYYIYVAILAILLFLILIGYKIISQKVKRNNEI